VQLALGRYTRGSSRTKVRRIIGKWLNAGVMEAGNVQYPEKGTP
jgi:hypothetical protein